MLIALPLLLIPVVLYNIVVLSSLIGGGSEATMAAGGADAILRDPMFSIPMASGTSWNVGPGVLMLLLSLILVFFELL